LKNETIFDKNDLPIEISTLLDNKTYILKQLSKIKSSKLTDIMLILESKINRNLTKHEKEFVFEKLAINLI
jgi:hypothetical protein